MKSTDTSFYVTGGTMHRDAPSYVERKADRQLLEGLLRGEFCYVLTSRQMGKSSLMVRTADKLRAMGIATAALDLSAVGQNLTPEQWYDGLLARMGRQLGIEEEIDEFWTKHRRLGPVQRFFEAIEEVVLAGLKGDEGGAEGISGRKESKGAQEGTGERSPREGTRPGKLVVFIDEIDVVRSLPFSMDEFFAAIRECYNRRAEDPDFERVTFCLLGVATPSDLIRDTRITPFNIGMRIELNDFTEEEATPLAHGLPARIGRSTAESLLKRVLHWTSGHPYLTQRLCQALAEEQTDVRRVRARGLRTDRLKARGPQTVDRRCRELFLSSRACEKDDNLIFVRERLLRSEVDRTSLLNLYERVLNRNPVADDETNPLVSVLRLSGVVRAINGRLFERNRIYGRVFDANWVHANLPDADLRRQREAFLRGVVRTTAIAAVVIAAMSIMVAIAVNQARNATLARATASFMQAQARRVSGLSGQRYESLQALSTARALRFPDQTKLRDEAIACMALLDLREVSNGLAGYGESSLSKGFGSAAPREGTRPIGGVPRVAVNLDHEISAVVESNGEVTVSQLRDRTVVGRTPKWNGGVERLWLTDKTPLLIIQEKEGPMGRIVVWDWREGREVSSIPRESHGEAIDFSADGTLMAVGDRGGSIVTYAICTGRKISEFTARLSSQLPKVAAAIRFDPAGTLLALSSADDHIVEVWDVNSRRQVAKFFHRDTVNDMAWNSQGSLLGTACSDGSIYLWSTNVPKTPQRILKGHESKVLSLTFNRRGDLIASLGDDETIRVWNTATDEQLITEEQVIHRVPRSGLHSLRFSGNDHLLLARTRTHDLVRVWEVLGGESYVVRPRSSRYFAGLDFSPDSQLVAAATSDTVTIWEVASGFERAVLSFTNISSVCFDAANERLLVSTDHGLLQCSLEREQTKAGLLVKPGPASRLATITNQLGRLTLNPARNKAAVVWQTNVLAFACDQTMSQTRLCVGERFTMLEIHPSGEWIAGRTSLEEVVRVFGLGANHGTRINLPLSHGDHFGFSPNGNWLAVSGQDGFDFYRVGAWSNPSFRLLTTSESDENGPFAFSRDGRTVAVVHAKYHVRLHALAAAPGESRVLATLESPDRKPFLGFVLSPDARYLAAAMQDQSIRIWDLGSIRQNLANLNLDAGWSNSP